MRIIKMSTENLVCYKDYDLKGQKHYQIFEKENEVKPIAIYVDKTHMKLADEFPRPENKYKYFKEMCKIVGALIENENQESPFEK